MSLVLDNPIQIDEQKLFEEAQVLSSYEHLAAVFNVSVDALAAYKHVIERGRLVSEHNFLKQLKLMVDAQDKDAIRIWAERTNPKTIDREAPITAEEQLNSNKVLEIFGKK